MKSNSIKRKLFSELSILITLAIIITNIIGFFLAKHEINEIFDATLVKSGKLILGLIQHEINEEQDANFLINPELIDNAKLFHRYEYKLHSQAWKEDRLVYNSDTNIFIQKPDFTGFSDIQIDQKNWRAFSFYDSNTDVRVLVLEESQIRNELVLEILTSLILPLLFSFILIVLIIWKVINKGLSPFGKLADKIEKMSAKTLEEFRQPNLPREIKPFINSFNSLILRLQKSMESERRFNDYAAHELRTPLSVIKTQSQLILKNKNKEKEEEFLNDLIKAVNRATHLVNQMLTLARLEPENKDFEKEEVNLLEITNLILSNNQTNIDQKNIKIKTNINPELSIFGNRTYFEILINNLIDNAIKYSPQNGEIEINIFKQNSTKIIQIINSGKLLSKEEESKIFDNFYRIKNENNKEDNVGCGLGLAICKKITDLHQGSISLVSKDSKNIFEVRF